MKKLMLAICCLSVLLVSSQALAVQPTLSISDLYAQAQSGWHQSYDTQRGETVTVDVDIVVPDVSAFPCYYAEDMPPVEGVPTSKNDIVEYGDASSVNNPGVFRYDWPGLHIQRQWREEAQKNGIFVENSGHTLELMLRYGRFDMDTAYSVNNPSTMRDAEVYMTECLQTFFPDRQIGLIPHQIQANIAPGKYEQNEETNVFEMVREDPDRQCVFIAYFDQTIEEIPVLGFSYQGFAGYRGNGKRDENKGDPGGSCVMYGLKNIGRDELYRSLILRLFSVTDLIAGDVPFCGLDAVMQTAEQLIYAGQLRKVDSMRLGYVVWLDAKHNYQLLPTWVIEGELFADAAANYKVPLIYQDDVPLEYANVYINAQTGELINPWKSNKNRAYEAPGLIPWK